MKHFKIWGVFIFFTLILVSFFLFSFSYKPNISLLADKMVSKCKDAKVRSYCYETEIPKLMNFMKMEDVFAVTEQVQSKDSGFSYCHDLSHKLSEIESKRSGWKDTVARCPLSLCNYGCLHGVFATKFGYSAHTDAQIEQEMPEILTVCEPRPGFFPTDIELNQCYHGIGHLAMFLTGGDPKKALSICERITTKTVGIAYSRLCAEGAFMSVFQNNTDPDYIALVKNIKPSIQGIPTFCARYGSYWDVCRRSSFAMVSQAGITPNGLVEFCSYSTDLSMKEYCYSAVINLFTTQSFTGSNGFDLVSNFCKGLPKSDQELCFADVAARLIQTDIAKYGDTASKLCALSASMGYNRCYMEMAGYAGFVYGNSHNEARVSYCKILPLEWNQRCLTGK